MTEETSQSTETTENTEPKVFGWVAGLPTGMQVHPENPRTAQKPQVLTAEEIV